MEVGAELDPVDVRPFHKLMQPGEIVVAALRLVVVPAEAPPPGIHAKLVHHPKVERDIV